MVIHDRGYSRWSGDRSRPVAAIGVILRSGLRRSMAILFRRKLPAIDMLLGAYGMFTFAFVLLIAKQYVLMNAATIPGSEDFLQSELVEAFSARPGTLYGYMFQTQAVFIALACVLLGAPLIAEDRRSNALELYFSRPVGVAQYLLGKLAIIATLLAAITVIPATILLLLDTSLTANQPGVLGAKLVLLGRTLAAGAVLVALPSLLILAASSLTQRARNAAILFMGLVVMLELVVPNILVEVFSEPYFHLLQISFNLSQVGAWILANTPDIEPAVPVWLSGVVLAAWVAVLVPLLVRRVRPVEVVA
jgi:ABC-type transport system involved in multi-copper enzyme maturation permease subunit